MKRNQSILTTKINLPHSNHKHLKRDQLFNILDSGNQRKITLISAPAGFGKTSLTADWLRDRKRKTAWFSLDENDNDPTQFFTYFISALQAINPQIGTAALEQLQMVQLTSLQTPIIDLINDITNLNSPIILVLDDLHVIENKAIIDLLTFFIENSPPNFHLIILSRFDPAIPLARLRSRGLLTEIRIKDLSFSLDETNALLKAVIKNPLTKQDIELLYSKTEGWIAGLQLAIISIQSKENISTFLQQFGGGHQYIVDYLMQEALNNQSDDVIQFLLQTSMMNRFCAELCNTVLDRDNSRELINYFEQNNMFIFALDDEKKWFRYHHLFGDLLKNRLMQDSRFSIKELHKKCASWFMENDFKVEALEHAFAAEDFTLAADLVEQLAEIKWEYGYQTGILKWFDILPNDVFNQKPMLNLLHAKELLLSGRFEEAVAKLNSTEKNQLSEIKPEKLDGRAASIKAFLSLCTGDIPSIITHAETALNKLDDDELIWRGLSAVLAGIALYWMGTGATEKAKKYMIEAVNTAQKQDNKFLYLTNLLQIIITEKNQGKLNDIYIKCEEALTFANNAGLSHSGIMGLIYAEMGDILIEQNDFEQGMLYLEKAIKISETDVDLFRMWNCHDHLARALIYKGEYQKALEIINKILSSITNQPMPPWFVNITLAQKAQLLLSLGNIDGAMEIISQLPISKDGPFIIIFESPLISLARVLIAQNNYNDAWTILSQLSQITESDTRFKAAIEIRILRASTLFMQNKMDEATEEIIQALTLGEAGEFISMFTVEGKPIAGLVKRALQSKAAGHKFSKNYADRVLKAFQLEEGATFDSDQLSPRELDVLHCLEQGMSNQEITEKLFISLNTVKTHLKRMSVKLDAKNRTEIIAKARDAGLI